MKRLSIVAHYDKDDLIDEYVWYLLNRLKEVCSAIVFVTASQISPNDILRLEETCSKVIIRQNIGYDFASWKSGIQAIANIADFDELVVCNDSVYGPFYPLPDIFNIMSQKDCDFWAMTDSYEIAYHLQSYFLVFKKRVIDSTAFKAFWGSVQIEETKAEVIKKYEVGLTQHLLAAGFRACAYAPYSFSQIEVLGAKASRALRQPRLVLKTLNRRLRREELADLARANPTHYFWRELITEHKMPFMKVELLRDNPLGIDISDWEEVVSNNCKYDVNLIKRHLARIKGTS